MDREKVVKGLEHCSSEEGCRGCPYNKTESGHACSFDCIRDALALLKEQDSVEYALDVLRRNGWKDDSYGDLLKEQEAVEPYSINAERTYGMCHKCGKLVFRYSNVEENHYCGICGQAVKWDG